MPRRMNHIIDTPLIIRSDSVRVTAEPSLSLRSLVKASVLVVLWLPQIRLDYSTESRINELIVSTGCANSGSG